MKLSGKNSNSSGQTLIETLAALFILVMGVGAATGLAVYAFGASSNINKEIIATGLAREGLEAVRNMRDTNWLHDTLVSNGCYNFSTSSANAAPCYLNWLGRNGSPYNGTTFFCIFPDGNEMGQSCQNDEVSLQVYVLSVANPASTSGPVWQLLDTRIADNTAPYGMTFNASNSNGNGFYTQDGVSLCGKGSNPADYCRKIVITNYSQNNGNAVSPYNVDDNLSIIKVQSEVWWIDKKCPRVIDYSVANPACRIELDTYLTNWKNF